MLPAVLYIVLPDALSSYPGGQGLILGLLTETVAAPTLNTQHAVEGLLNMTLKTSPVWC